MALDEMNRLFDEIEERPRLEEDVQNRIRVLREQAVNDAIGFLQLLGVRSKSAAKAAFAIQKALALKETIVSTHAAATKAIQIYGPTPKGFVAAAAAIAYGAARAAAIVSTALEGTNQINAGAAIGTPANPVFTQPTPEEAARGRETTAVQIIFNGPVADREVFLDLIRDAIDRDVVVISQNTRQAQVIRGE
jgi:hypothetical protein